MKLNNCRCYLESPNRCLLIKSLVIQKLVKEVEASSQACQGVGVDRGLSRGEMAHPSIYALAWLTVSDTEIGSLQTSLASQLVFLI